MVARAVSIAGVLGGQVMEYFRRRVVIFALVLAIFGLGIVAGGIAVGVVQDDSRIELSRFVDGYLAHVSSAPLGQSDGEARSFMIQEVLRGAMLPWLLGLSVIGAPVILALIFLRGFALGFTLMFLFEELSYRGLLLAFAGILPQALIGVPGVLLAGGACIAFSLGAAKVLTGRRDEASVYSQAATATILTLAAATLILCSTWIQGNVSPVLVETVSGYVRP